MQEQQRQIECQLAAVQKEKMEKGQLSSNIKLAKGRPAKNSQFNKVNGNHFKENTKMKAPSNGANSDSAAKSALLVTSSISPLKAKSSNVIEYSSLVLNKGAENISYFIEKEEPTILANKTVEEKTMV